MLQVSIYVYTTCRLLENNLTYIDERIETQHINNCRTISVQQ